MTEPARKCRRTPNRARGTWEQLTSHRFLDYVRVAHTSGARILWQNSQEKIQEIVSVLEEYDRSLLTWTRDIEMFQFLVQRVGCDVNARVQSWDARETRTVLEYMISSWSVPLDMLRALLTNPTLDRSVAHFSNLKETARGLLKSPTKLDLLLRHGIIPPNPLALWKRIDRRVDSASPDVRENLSKNRGRLELMLSSWPRFLPRWDGRLNGHYFPKEAREIAFCWLLCARRLKIAKDVANLIVIEIMENWKEEQYAQVHANWCTLSVE